MWRTRGLSLIGKIEILNMLIGSLFVYKGLLLPKIPEQYLGKLKTLFQTFLWNGRKPKIKLEMLMGLKEDGGMGLVISKKGTKL